MKDDLIHCFIAVQDDLFDRNSNIQSFCIIEGRTENDHVCTERPHRDERNLDHFTINRNY